MPAEPRALAITESARVAELYEQGRPGYPREAVQRVASELGLTRDSVVLDLAAGTGKFTRVIRAVADRVIAVEPSEPMLAQLHAQLPEVDARLASAEDLPLAEGSVDAVFVAEAFHWFDAERALPEIARILTARGGLALVWNRHRWGAGGVPWSDAFDELLEPYRARADTTLTSPPDWEAVLAGSGLFDRPQQFEVDHVHELSLDGLLALVSSWTWIAALEESERARLLDRISDLVGSYGELELKLPYRARVLWSRVNKGS